MQDVTRLLYLLNKKPSKVKMPVDGVRLMRWSENILKRYLASQVSNHGRALALARTPYVSSKHFPGHLSKAFNSFLQDKQKSLETSEIPSYMQGQGTANF